MNFTKSAKCSSRYQSRFRFQKTTIYLSSGGIMVNSSLPNASNCMEQLELLDTFLETLKSGEPLLSIRVETEIVPALSSFILSESGASQELTLEQQNTVKLSISCLNAMIKFRQQQATTGGLNGGNINAFRTSAPLSNMSSYASILDSLASEHKCGINENKMSFSSLTDISVQTKPHATTPSLNKYMESSQLDSFVTERKRAIRHTIMENKDLLPSMNDIVGHQRAKEALREALVDPFIHSDWFKSSNLTPWKCVLLYGPPGTGKSHLSKSVAREFNARFYQVSSSDLLSSWSGQSEKLIRELFDHALDYNQSAVIFIDEIDSLCRKRSSSESETNRRIKTELLIQLQRLHDSPNSLLLVCATNCPWDLDTAFLRRFEKKIYVGLLDNDSRVTLLKNALSKAALSNDVVWGEIADATDRFTGDDLKRLAQELSFAQFRKYKSRCQASNSTATQSIGFVASGDCSMKQCVITAADFKEALRLFIPTVNAETLAKFERFQ